MKKISVILSSILLVASVCFFPEAVKAANAETAASERITLGGEELELLLPGGYEQYLPLSANVSSIAVSGEYIAVADDDTIYLYDGEKYEAYVHTKGTVSQIELFEGQDGYTLYFQDKFADLYRYDCTALTEMETAPHDAFQQGSAFALSETGELYFSRISESVGAIYVDRATEENIFDTFSGKTTMYYYDGFLYYTTNGNKLVKREKRGSVTSSVEEYGGLNSSVEDIVIYGNTLFYTAEGKLYTYDLNSRVHGKSFDDLNYSALCTDGSNYLYVLGTPDVNSGENTKILRLDMQSEEFTDYEIGTSSSAENRLMQTKRSIINGDKLIVADRGRLTVYDKKDGRFYTIKTEFDPDYIASNGKTILIAKQSITASEVLIYDFEGKKVAGASGFIGGIVGAVCVREADYYLTTSSNVCYKIDGQTFSKTQAAPRQMPVTATELASDIYGNLYVEYSDKTVYKYTEEEFFGGAGGDAIYKFGTIAANLTVDFDGNVYGSSGDTIYCSDGTEYKIDGTGFLYNAAPTFVSFSFGYEHNGVYLVYDNYILYTESIDLPNINNLAVGNTYYNIFQANKEISVVEVKSGALLIDFSLEELKETSGVFPACSYSRSAEEMQTVVMDDELVIHGKEYYVIAVFDAQKRTYDAKLTLKEFCRELSREEYLSDPVGFTDGEGYLTNDVFLYKYPYLNEIVALQRLRKNAKLHIVGELALNEQTDFEYYYVYYTDGAETVYGYVPKSFIRNVDTSLQEPDIIKYTPEEANGTDALRYLLIAILALLDIAIVVNYTYILLRDRE